MDRHEKKTAKNSWSTKYGTIYIEKQTEQYIQKKNEKKQTEQYILKKNTGKKK